MPTGIQCLAKGNDTANREMAMRNAVAYIRVSTTDQADSGAGLAAQRAAIETFAKANGLNVTAWHEDAGVSGAADLEDRPALMAALGELRRGMAFIVAKRDRVARDTFTALVIEKAVTKKGGVILSADNLGNGDGPADEFMRSILNATATFERSLIRSRTRAAMAAKRAAGQRVGEVPFGWDLDAGRLVENAAEQKVISRILDCRRAGMSLREIAAILNGQAITTKKGRRWYGETVRSILERAAALAA
jgi:DNA invertase Pin-like site-specific DNA recombinase